MNTFMGKMVISSSKGEAGMQVTSHLLMYVLEVRFLTPQRTACQRLDKPQMYFHI